MSQTKQNTTVNKTLSNLDELEKYIRWIKSDLTKRHDKDNIDPHDSDDENRRHRSNLYMYGMIDRFATLSTGIIDDVNHTYKRDIDTSLYTSEDLMDKRLGYKSCKYKIHDNGVIKVCRNNTNGNRACKVHIDRLE